MPLLCLELLGAAAALLCVVAAWRRNRGLPPGPWGLPLLGYFPFLRPRCHEQLGQLASRYGQVMSFRTLGGDLIVLLNGLPVLKEALVSRAGEFTGRPLQTNLLSWFDNGLGITQTEGWIWKEQRRFFLQTAKSFGFGKSESEPLIQEHLRSMMDDLRALNGDSVDPLLHTSQVTANVIATILFQKTFRKSDPRFEQLARGLHQLVDIFADRRTFLIGPIFEYGLLKLVAKGREVSQVKDIMMSTMKEIVEEHLNTFDESNLRDYVDTYLHQIRKLDENGTLSQTSFSIDRLIAISLNMLMEGTESVGTTLCCLLCELSRHEEAQKKAQEELDAAVGRNRYPSWLDRKNLPYVEALIQELYRMNQAFFFSTHYSNFEETTLRGYRIPKRSVIIANYWAINNDANTFPEPWRFDPGRFLDANGKKLKQAGPTPFGIGKRECVGESLAQMEVFLCIACILQSFSISPGTQDGCIRAIPRK